MGIGCDVSSDHHYLLLLAQVSIHHHNLVLLVQVLISPSIDPSSLPTTVSSSIEPSSIPTAASPSIDQSLLSQISSPASASVAVPSGTIQFLDLPSATTAPAQVAMPAAYTRSSSWNSSVHTFITDLQCCCCSCSACRRYQSQVPSCLCSPFGSQTCRRQPVSNRWNSPVLTQIADLQC